MIQSFGLAVGQQKVSSALNAGVGQPIRFGNHRDFDVVGGGRPDSFQRRDGGTPSTSLIVSRPGSRKLETIPTPREIVSFLDQHVVGQEKAKRTLAVAAHDHYIRLTHDDVSGLQPTWNGGNPPELKKGNVLMMGPSGSGKTLLMQTLAKRLHVPFVHVDATKFTEAGYVGEDVESILSRLLQAADGDKTKAEQGIVFIDEIDKKGIRSENVSITRDVSGEGVQQALLRIIEGDMVKVPPGGGRKHPNGEMVEMDTRNILFVVGGAFVGLEDIIERRLNAGSSSMGFNAPVKDKGNKARPGTLLPFVTTDDLKQFGLIPELLGRLPKWASTRELGIPELVRVLVEPQNALIKQYQYKMNLLGADLHFPQETLEAVAKMAHERRVGARGLESILQKCMEALEFEVPDLARKGRQLVIHITPEVIEQQIDDFDQIMTLSEAYQQGGQTAA